MPKLARVLPTENIPPSSPSSLFQLLIDSKSGNYNEETSPAFSVTVPPALDEDSLSSSLEQVSCSLPQLQTSVTICSQHDIFKHKSPRTTPL